MKKAVLGGVLVGLVLGGLVALAVLAGWVIQPV
jgi:hypothetical protein